MSLLRLSRIESILVYNAWGREIDIKDRYPDEVDLMEDEAIESQIIQKDLEILEKFENLTCGAQPAPEPR